MPETLRPAAALAALLFLAAPVRAQPPPGAAAPAVTLAEAIARALEVQPAMVQARGAVSNAAWQSRAAYGAFLPSLSVSSSAYRVNTPSVTNGLPTQAGSYQYNSGLSASVDLFDGFRRIAGARGAAAAGEASGAGLVSQRYQVTLQTQQLFYTALANDELMRVAVAQLRRAREEREIAVNKFMAGAATRADTLTATVGLGNARLALLQAQANLATAQATLARQIGREGEVRALPDTVMPAPVDTAGLRAAALAGAPSVRAAESASRAASASLWQTRAQFWPALSLSYSASSQGGTAPWDGFESGNRNLNQLRFGLSWTLFNGFSREQAVAQSGASRDLARAQAEDARRQVDAQLTQQVAAMRTAYEQIAISAENVDAASEALRVQQDRYRLGAGTLLDLLTAESNFIQAQVSHVQARYNYLDARAQLEAIVGRTL
ncbi:MAG: hypothetical protein A2W00_00270 [Candidatus Eisenbacteria bacterium RBG_16_71_46]|nr:MAG: hypothetical protein A2W00_00270 [Candidatus Eisenbacteria bacterium RBG_16_71_46]